MVKIENFMKKMKVRNFDVNLFDNSYNYALLQNGNIVPKENLFIKNIEIGGVNSSIIADKNVFSGVNKIEDMKLEPETCMLIKNQYLDVYINMQPNQKYEIYIKDKVNNRIYFSSNHGIKTIFFNTFKDTKIEPSSVLSDIQNIIHDLKQQELAEQPKIDNPLPLVRNQVDLAFEANLENRQYYNDIENQRVPGQGLSNRPRRVVDSDDDVSIDYTTQNKPFLKQKDLRIGPFKNGKRDGSETETMADGSKFIGKFVAGKTAQGAYYNSEGQETGEATGKQQVNKPKSSSESVIQANNL